MAINRLNVSKVAENGLVNAITRLNGSKPEKASEEPFTCEKEGWDQDLKPGRYSANACLNAFMSLIQPSIMARFFFSFSGFFSNPLS